MFLSSHLGRLERRLHLLDDIQSRFRGGRTRVLVGFMEADPLAVDVEPAAMQIEHVAVERDP